MRTWVLALLVLLAPFASCSIVKKPPPKPVELSYNDLVCTEQDRANIYEIVSTVGEKGKIALLFNQAYLREKGAQINHVHPLKFLGVIFSNPHLKMCMAYIWDDYFKRNNFLTDLSAALSREADRGKLHPYLNDFAKEVNVPPESIKGYFDSRDWANFLLFLIQS